MNRLLVRSLCATVAATLLSASAVRLQAQCSSCSTPPVAATPVTVGYAPTVTYEPYNGWYLGKMLDNWRWRRWTRNSTTTYTAAYAPATAYSASYTPYYASYAPASYSAGYAPTYSSAYTPYTASYAYTAAYRPYVTAYAPLARPVSYTSYYAPAVLQPVTAAVIEGSGCSACSTCGSTCDACSSGVGQAYYAEPSYSSAAPAGGCSACAASAGQPVYDDSLYSGSATVGPSTGRPELASPPPSSSQYDVNRANPDAGLPPVDPAPATEEDDAASYYPKLLKPVNDRTARAPSVDVWNAVYRRPAQTAPASTTARKVEVQQRQRTQAERDAELWH